MLWSLAGLAIALVVAAAALRCSRSPGGFYDRDTYGMSASMHSLVFALFFAASSLLRLETAGIAGLALYALIAIFYASSFLRGASDE
jgi:hypothetical protein